MAETIYTRYTTDAKGRGKVQARGNGRSRTVAYDHSKSRAENHGAVAGLLGDALGWGQNASITYVDKGNDGFVFTRHPETTWAKQILAASGNTDGA